MTVPEVVWSAVGFSVRVEGVMVLVLMMLRVAEPVRPLSDWFTPLRSSAVPAAVPAEPEILRLVGRALAMPRRTPEYPVAALVKMVEFPPNELPEFERVMKSPPVLGVGRRGPLPARKMMLAVVMPEDWVIVPVSYSDAPSCVPMRETPSALSSMLPLKMLFPLTLWIRPRETAGRTVEMAAEPLPEPVMVSVVV